MPSCSYLYCRNSTKNYKTADGRKLSFHKFPRVDRIREFWLENLRRDSCEAKFEPNSRAVLCSEHFTDSCFDDKSTKYPRLKNGAVPTLFLREGSMKKVEHENDEEEESSDKEQESWSGWHSWPNKGGSTEEEDGGNDDDGSKGLEELEELMEEEEEEEGDLNEERDDWMEDSEGEDGDGKGASEDRTGAVPSPLEEGGGTETGTGTDLLHKAQDCVQGHERITLDNVTMDPTLTSVRIGDKKMVSMTFQDILNSLVPTQQKDASKVPKEPKDSNPTSNKVKGHPDKGHQDTGYDLQGWETVQGKGRGGSSKATKRSIITPEFKESLTRHNKAVQKNKGTKKNRKDKQMVISIYRKNTMMRIISSKDLPYLCGDCGLAFTHAFVLKNHVEAKHDYSEPPEIKANGEILSQVVIHRDFEKKNLKTQTQVKELREKYAKTETVNGNRESEPAEQWFQKVDKSTGSLSDSDCDDAFPVGTDGGDDSVDCSVVEGADSFQTTSSKKKKPKRERKPKTDIARKVNSQKKNRDRCHRCYRYFKSRFECKQHIAEMHGEFSSQEVAQASWNKTTAGSSTMEVLKCLYCETFFTSRENAGRHLNKHCGVDGIKCDICTEAIKLWNEGRNMELEKLHEKYDGLKDEGQDGDEGRKEEETAGGKGETAGGEGAMSDDARKGDEGSSVNNDGKEKPDADDLIRQSLERAKTLSSKHFIIAKCFECNEEFFLRHHLVNHYRVHEKFTCKECGKEFKTMTDYQEHLDEVHKIGLCSCPYCPKKFPSLGKLNFHMLGHLGLFQCILCGATLMSKQSLEMHIRGAVSDPYHKLRVGGERLTYSSSNPFLGASQNENHRGGFRRRNKTKEISCKFCDRKFGYTHGLRKHMRFLHPKEEVPMKGDGFCCERCGIVLASKQSFKAHLQTHQEKTISCPESGCEAMFTTKMNLKSHLRTHGQASWSKRFRCDICGGTYKTQCYLDMHMKCHSGHVPYACSYCGKTFRNVTHMVYHERRMHTGQLDHTCELCGKGFADPSTLKVHSKTHSTHRPFVCDICSKGFPTKLYLQAHRRVHTKPFKCSQCNEGFSQQGARRNHLRKAHGIETPVVKSKSRISAQSETNPPGELSPQMSEASVQDIEETEMMVISDNNEVGSSEIIDKILAAIL